MTNTHIILVSAQAAPNLLPALDPALKPTEVVLLVTAKMKQPADALEKVFQQTGVKTTRVNIANEHDYDALETALMELAAARDGQSIALNVTGGTKLMALAAQSIADAAGWSVFYVNEDTDEVIWLGKNAAPRHPLTEQLRLRHYLMGYGFELVKRVERPQPSAQHIQLFDTLVNQIATLEQPLGQLNWLAQVEHRLQVELSPQQLDNRSLAYLLRIFEEANVLTTKGNTLIFNGENERKFANGGWLEHHVFRTVSALTGELKIRDKAANLEFTNASGVKNELDVAFMARNRLFVVECKTARMNNPESLKANDTLFKLSEICKRAGGLGSHGLLASYRALRESEMKLAEALNIKLVCGAELARLDQKLKEWVR